MTDLMIYSVGAHTALQSPTNSLQSIEIEVYVLSTNIITTITNFCWVSVWFLFVFVLHLLTYLTPCSMSFAFTSSTP